MNPRLLGRLLAGVLLVLALAVSQRLLLHAPGAAPATAPAAVEAPPVAPPSAGPEITHPEIGFRDAGRLAEHYLKHGAEFGQLSEAEYLARAQRLRDRPAGGDILEARRADGVITRFDREAGDFLAVNPDRTIRTYFRPNDGEAYFRRQLKRAPSP